MNIRLMDRDKSTITGAFLKKKLYDEEIVTSCCLINKSPTSTLVNKTPMEVWMGKNPSLQHLHVFGCEAYEHVPKEKYSKLDNKVVKCIFIGYGAGVKGNKLWDPTTRNFCVE